MKDDDLARIRRELEAQEAELTRLGEALGKHPEVVLEIDDDVDAQFSAIASGLRARPTPPRLFTATRA